MNSVARYIDAIKLVREKSWTKYLALSKDPRLDTTAFVQEMKSSVLKLSREVQSDLKELEAKINALLEEGPDSARRSELDAVGREIALTGSTVTVLSRCDKAISSRNFILARAIIFWAKAFQKLEGETTTFLEQRLFTLLGEELLFAEIFARRTLAADLDVFSEISARDSFKIAKGKKSSFLADVFQLGDQDPAKFSNLVFSSLPKGTPNQGATK